MMDGVMDAVARASLGPAPLPYICAVMLLPLWTLFPHSDHSLLYTLSAVVSVLLKGALFWRWAACRQVSWWWRPVLLGVVVVLETGVTHEALHIPWIPLVILVPLSSVTGSLIFRLHLGHRREESGNVIGIFSRSSPEEYRWLSDWLRNSGAVRPFYITNTNFGEFVKRVSQCHTAILYHSKNRGRINITDVTDSLYDQEVNHMSQKLAQSKVLVVVDDLDDSSDGAKARILHGQPTLLQQTGNLFLFSTREKSDRTLMAERLRPLVEAVNQGSWSSSISDVITILILAAPWLHFLYDAYQNLTLGLSNISGCLLLSVLLHSRSDPARADQAVLLLVVVVELVAVFFSYSGMRAGLLALQSLATLMWALCCALSSRSSSAAP